MRDISKSCHIQCIGYDESVTRDLTLLFIHFIVTIARLFGAGGARASVAGSLLVKHQLLILNRSRERAPKLRPMDRVITTLVDNDRWKSCCRGLYQLPIAA